MVAKRIRKTIATGRKRKAKQMAVATTTAIVSNSTDAPFLPFLEGKIMTLYVGDLIKIRAFDKYENDDVGLYKTFDSLKTDPYRSSIRYLQLNKNRISDETLMVLEVQTYSFFPKLIHGIKILSEGKSWWIHSLDILEVIPVLMTRNLKDYSFNDRRKIGGQKRKTPKSL
jgi:hypothetical protein